MSLLLLDEPGLVLLLCSAVLFGVITLGAASLARHATPPSVPRTGRTDGHGLVAGLSDRLPARSARAGEAQGYQSIVSRTAATAPTDAHMSLRAGFEALRLLLRRLLRLE